VANSNGVLFIDPIAEQWITGVQNQPGSGNAPQYIAADGLNPTAEGHKHLADRLVADLRRLRP
jgi:lysophospholipase L1-like esterase